MGTADGARTGPSGPVFMSGDWETMAHYLGSEVGNGRGTGGFKLGVVPGRAKREPGIHNHRIRLLLAVTTPSHRQTRSCGYGSRICATLVRDDSGGWGR